MGPKGSVEAYLVVVHGELAHAHHINTHHSSHAWTLFCAFHWHDIWIVLIYWNLLPLQLSQTRKLCSDGGDCPKTQNIVTRYVAGGNLMLLSDDDIPNTGTALVGVFQLKKHLSPRWRNN